MGRRNMYHLTGQPGWMRFGFSPGWVGRSPSRLGPCAHLLMTGQGSVPQAVAAPPLGASPEVRLGFLKNQASLLEQNLATIKAQIESLEGAED
jgi:hypothetical protein